MKRSVLLFIACASLTASRAAAEPGLVPVQGVLSNADGEPIDGEHRLTFVLYRAEDDDDRLFTDDYRNQQVAGGHFVVYLGGQDDNPLDLNLFAEEPEVWLETVIDGSEVIKPRTRLGSVPYAGFAQYCGEHTHDWSEITSGLPDLATKSDLQDQRATFGYDQGLGTQITLTDEWMTIPDLSVSVTLRTPAPVLMGFSLSVAVLDATVHCNFRYVVDGVGTGDPVYGDVIAMGDPGAHWQSVSDFIVRPLAAGTHTVLIQGRRYADPNQPTQRCQINAADYSGPTLFAIGFPQ